MGRSVLPDDVLHCGGVGGRAGVREPDGNEVRHRGGVGDRSRDARRVVRGAVRRKVHGKGARTISPADSEETLIFCTLVHVSERQRHFTTRNAFIG